MNRIKSTQRRQTRTKRPPKPLTIPGLAVDIKSHARKVIAGSVHNIVQGHYDAEFIDPDGEVIDGSRLSSIERLEYLKRTKKKVQELEKDLKQKLKTHEKARKQKEQTNSGGDSKDVEAS